VAQNYTVSTQHFYAFYLLSHGIIKVALVIGLLRDKLWAYPASLVVLGIFIVYQLYRFSYTQGFGLIVLTVFDVIVMGLIWHEYRLIPHHLPSPWDASASPWWPQPSGGTSLMMLGSSTRGLLILVEIG
jgi:uncharacterized membrane protein